ncbi:telomerase reverse transcriptase-like [Syngnathus acus]|uniref:telomerase reverse transcriptase-like n=1 Tax=Syngnathus acus TaxID=161584 RepID=UPI001885D556|nr:telomerase reverse transcriptase-like [Syngnathus acus]
MDLFKSFMSIIFVGYDNELQQAPSCHQMPKFKNHKFGSHCYRRNKTVVKYPGMSLRHSLTLGIVPSAQEQMRMKLMQILRLKCHPVFLDLKTNLVAAVYKNIYELVFLQALRFHVFARSLPFGQRVAKIPFNFLRMVWNMAYYTSHLIGQSNKGFPLRYIGFHFKKIILTGKRSLERRLGDLQLARVRQAANPCVGPSQWSSGVATRQDWVVKENNFSDTTIFVSQRLYSAHMLMSGSLPQYDIRKSLC